MLLKFTQMDNLDSKTPDKFVSEVGLDCHRTITYHSTPTTPHTPR